MADRGDRKYTYSESKSMSSSSEDPPNSRLFIICSKQLTEDDFREAFGKFGEIEEIWVVKDRQTGDRKGVTYIKYSKTSEAAKAMEAMNGKIIGNTNRQIKVMIAASREQGSRRDNNEEEKTQRLFVIVPKTMTDSELHDVFKQYGEIDYVTIIRDRETRESKGFAYIKFYKFSHAAIAYEQCDRKYKAVFAEPRRPNIRSDPPEKSFSSSFDNSFKNNSPYLPAPPPDIPNDGYTRLHVIASPVLNQDQIWKLFDLIPGMDYCQLKLEGRPRPSRAVASVVYSNPQWATYACQKFHGFEYPPGHRLIVKPDPDSRVFPNPASNPIRNKPDLMQIAETIAQASSLIQAAGLSQDNISKLGLLTPKSETSICSVPLPDLKPLVSIDEETVARCFIVCAPQPPPPHILRDVFCRFGNLIDVYMLANRNCGYAKYASRVSAENAIKTLHGAEIYGVRVKVLEAEERNDSKRKRLRLDDGST